GPDAEPRTARLLRPFHDHSARATPGEISAGPGHRHVGVCAEQLLQRRFGADAQQPGRYLPNAAGRRDSGCSGRRANRGRDAPAAPPADEPPHPTTATPVPPDPPSTDSPDSLDSPAGPTVARTQLSVELGSILPGPPDAYGIVIEDVASSARFAHNETQVFPS